MWGGAIPEGWIFHDSWRHNSLLDRASHIHSWLWKFDMDWCSRIWWWWLTWSGTPSPLCNVYSALKFSRVATVKTPKNMHDCSCFLGCCAISASCGRVSDWRRIKYSPKSSKIRNCQTFLHSPGCCVTQPYHFKLEPFTQVMTCDTLPPESWGQVSKQTLSLGLHTIFSIVAKIISDNACQPQAHPQQSEFSTQSLVSRPSS